MEKNDLLFLLFFSCSFLTLLSAESELEFSLSEQQYIHENPLIRVHVEKNWPPYSYVEYGEIKGFFSAYMKLISRKAGLEILFIQGYTWDSYLHMLENHDIDILCNMTITEDRLKLALFSEKAIFNIHSTALSKKGSQIYSSFEELRDKNLALISGCYQEEYLRKKYPGINLVLTHDTQGLIRQVMEGRADMGIGFTHALKYHINRNFYTGLQYLSFEGDPLFTDVPQHIAIRDDRPLLKSIIDKAMASVSLEEMRTLQDIWLPGRGGDYIPVKAGELRLSSEEIKYLKGKDSLIFSANPDWMPLEGIQNEIYQGIGSDFMTLFEEKLGVDFILFNCDTPEAAKNAVYNTESDLMFMVMKSESWKEQLNFSRPYFSGKLVMVTTPEKSYVGDFSSLQGYKIGVLQGYAPAEILPERYPGLQFVEIPSIRKGMDMVVSEELYGYVDALEVISFYKQRNNYSLVINGQLDEKYELSIATRKDEPHLAVIVEKLIDSIDIKTRQHIINNWISSQYEPGFDPHILKLMFSILIPLILILAGSQILLIRYNRKLDILSKYDSLTKMYNRRMADELLENNTAQCERYDLPLSVILCDIDHFKRINDTFGHPKGDEILIDIAEHIKKGIRDSDTCGRWGGEEFLIICPQTDAAGAERLAENLRMRIERAQFSIDQEVTLSFGVSQFDKGLTPADLIALSDTALYESKNRGRNRVSVRKRGRQSL